MPGEPVRFPVEAIRDIHIRHVKQTSCGPFAIITVDFEPLPSSSTGVRLAVPHDVELGYQGYVDHQELFGYLDAIAAGVRAELTAEARTTPATRVLVRRIVIHEVDSSERGFRTAGELAAREALKRFVAPDGEPLGTPRGNVTGDH
ncbi:hypothetical protein [Streptacidiphilus jiangxiensis]|uniref:Translation elongation factor EFG/EF2 domain-containing protein n=1 Tax=Streptacidiphilus jiangxiensis TaxID=235985 RepID=A0A1H7TKJ0_STRJI|nr:hypothetical protein [Streptacidiphilus jiangxiensis]SEL85422.1 hypothetical protein SAMN05414137_11450 [Streptacidiphilus jiangxiensis]